MAKDVMVKRAITQGKTNRYIAKMFNVTVAYVEGCRQEMRKKL